MKNYKHVDLRKGLKFWAMIQKEMLLLFYLKQRKKVDITRH